MSAFEIPQKGSVGFKPVDILSHESSIFFFFYCCTEQDIQRSSYTRPQIPKRIGNSELEGGHNNFCCWFDRSSFIMSPLPLLPLSSAAD